MASIAVSLSRISHTIIISGSWRTRVLSPDAKSNHISGLTWVWFMNGILYSTGSSSVDIFRSRGLKFFNTENSVVDFHDQVGQATSTIQYLLFKVSLILWRLTSKNSSLFRSRSDISWRNIRITTFSQSTIGNRLTRISRFSWVCSIVKAIFQSWGRCFSSILRFAIILRRASNLVYSSGEILSIYIKSQLSLNLADTKFLLGSRCISEVPRSIASFISSDVYTTISQRSVDIGIFMNTSLSFVLCSNIFIFCLSLIYWAKLNNFSQYIT